MNKTLRDLIDNLIDALEPNIDVNSMSLEELISRENEIVSHPATLFLSLLKENSLIQAVIEDTDFPDIVDVKEIKNHFLHFSFRIQEFIKKAEKYRDALIAKDAELDEEHELVLSDDSFKGYQNTAVFLNLISPLFSYIDKVFSIGDSIDDKYEYVKLVSKYNKKYEKVLNNLYNHVLASNNLEVGSPDTYNSVIKLFTKSARLIDPELFEKQTQEPVYKKTTKNTEISDSEKERIALVKRANAMFDELCIDWIRDFDSQVPYSTKKAYDEFKNGKFKKFAQRMPLDMSVSAAQAQEAINQINNMMNNLCNISSQSYVTNYTAERN